MSRQAQRIFVDETAARLHAILHMPRASPSLMNCCHCQTSVIVLQRPARDEDKWIPNSSAAMMRNSTLSLTTTTMNSTTLSCFSSDPTVLAATVLK